MKHDVGIVKTEYGYRAFVRVKGVLYSKRFADSATPTAMRDWRAAQRTDALRAAAKREGRTPAPGTFAQDVATYLNAVKTMRTYAEREQHLHHWVAALGKDRRRSTITPDEIRAVLQQWRTDGKQVRKRGRAAGTAPLSESGCNHRRTALMHLFTVLDGKSAANPVREVPKFREPDPEPRGVPIQTVRRILMALPDSATKARASVMAWTGLPQATLMQIRHEDVRWAECTVYVQRRRKGKGTKARMVPLLPEAIRALRLMKKWDAWGTFSTSSLNHSIARACRAIGVPVIRAYDLRHSFAAAVYGASGDIHAVQTLLDHSDQKLTARYSLAAVDHRVQQAITATRKVTSPVTSKGKRRGKR